MIFERVLVMFEGVIYEMKPGACIDCDFNKFGCPDGLDCGKVEEGMRAQSQCYREVKTDG